MTRSAPVHAPRRRGRSATPEAEALRSAVARALRAQRAFGAGAADDLVEDVLAAVAGNRVPWRGRSSFTTWLWSVVRRRLRDTRRHRIAERRALEQLAVAAAPAPVAGRTPEQLASDREECGRALAVLERLPRREALSFVLLRVADWSAADVARRVGGTAAAVRVRAHRVAAGLRKAMADSAPPRAHGRTRSHRRTAAGGPKRRPPATRSRPSVTIRRVALPTA